MIDYLKDKIDNYPGDKQEKYHYLRELLQLLLLKNLDESGYFQNIAFIGGTALRILYDLKRFSEDLDFSLINPNNFSFPTLIEKLKLEYQHETIELDIKIKDKYPIASALFKFKGLLHELKLSSHKDEVIFIKFEIDMNPPSGSLTELTLISKEFMISINHFDLTSLYAGKLHAILQRKYTKGRDFYDYLWYCGRNTTPNLTLLNNAMEQSAGNNPNLTVDKLKLLLKAKFTETDFNHVKQDVAPFLIDAGELRFFNAETFMATLK